MIAQFKQDLYNKHFTLQDQGKDNPFDTIENRIKFWINIIENLCLTMFIIIIITTKDWMELF